MSRSRIILVHVLLGLILTGTAYAIISQRELWPFSPYPMYSWIEHSRSVTRLQLYGVTAEAKPREIPVVAMKYLAPLDDARLYVALQRLHGPALKKALAEMLQRYEKLRRKGEHQGPPIQGLRLYQLTWKHIDPKHFKPSDPDQRRLISQVERPAES